MPTARRPRRGSLQFYPRKRARKFLSSVNWRPVSINSNIKEGILGFVAYKSGMTTALVKDNGEKSMTKGKQIVLPVTILEAPNMKVFSVRFYKNGKVLTEVAISTDKELKRKLKIPRASKKLEENIPEGYDDIRLLVYSLPKTTSLKKTPDLIEVAINSNNKIELVKNLIHREISIFDFIKPDQTVYDVRSLTKGKGTQGPVKRFGIKLRFHKSEKGVRKPGSIGPWHPRRVTFRVPLAGQLGLFSRIIYNLYLLGHGSIKEKDINPKSGFKNYGKINTSYLIIKGSVSGPAKRQVLLTPALRPSSQQLKKKFEFVEVLPN